MAFKNTFFIVMLSLFLISMSGSAYTESVCGNGRKDFGEQCDDGDMNSDTRPNACRTDCRRSYCGDGVTDSGEQCDDGIWNSDTKADACRTNCIRSSCGDGVADSREQCDGDDLKLNICMDHGYTSGYLSCKNDCVFDFSECRYCGDGIVNDAEKCDDGNNIDDDGCNTDCTPCILLDQVGNIDLIENAELCTHSYQMDDYGDFGVIVIKKTGITLDCDGAILKGEGRGIGIVNFRSHNVTIKNCEVHGYEVGIKIQDAKDTTLEGNRLCGNSISDIELADATNNHGQNNRCNRAGGWRDDGKSACSSKFVPCNIETVTIDRQVAAVGPSASTAYQIQKPSPTHERQGTSRSYQSFKEDLKSPPGKALSGKSKHPASTSSTITPSSPTRGTRTAAVTQTAPAGTTYLLYNNAHKADWTSKAGKVVFGSDRVPQAGRVQILASGRLADGKQARNLLVTQPDWKRGGFINGVFPTIRLKKSEHFYATIGMLKGPVNSNDAIFEVLIREGRQVTTAVRKHIRDKNPLDLNIDLSRWSGKDVQVILRVHPVKSGQQFSAVWVNPRIAPGS